MPDDQMIEEDFSTSERNRLGTCDWHRHLGPHRKVTMLEPCVKWVPVEKEAGRSGPNTPVHEQIVAVLSRCELPPDVMFAVVQRDLTPSESAIRTAMWDLISSGRIELTPASSLRLRVVVQPKEVG